MDLAKMDRNWANKSLEYQIVMVVITARLEVTTLL